jgi:outer membrane lipase/esterase
MKSMKWKVALLATAAAAILVGCGGGGADSTSQRAGITSVKVMGDSLSDSGVFTGLPGYGRVFSVQGSSSEPNSIWTERITALFGAPQLCNFFKFTAQRSSQYNRRLYQLCGRWRSHQQH